MNAFAKTVIILAVIGAINWGLIGFFNWNLVAAIFGGGTETGASVGSRIVYSLVGLAGLAALFVLPRMHTTEQPGLRPRTTAT
ncbi:MAG: DUF378 domain-containing protein [Enhygromyxa sp.]